MIGSVWLPGLLAVVLLTAVYWLTLQRDINGSGHDYMIDVGEIQVALNLGGTIHFTGYPLFTVLSTLVTAVARLFGMVPAAAASLSGLVWSVLALLVTYAIFWRLTQDAWISAAGVLLLGLVETIWIHSVIAEVYSFSLLCLTLSLWLGLRLAERWRLADWLGMCLVFGTAVAHHRLLLLFAPSLAVLTVTAVWSQPTRWRLISVGLLLFLASFLTYLYLPLRVWQEAAWVYGQPGQWDGFWLLFTGNEVTGGLLRAPGNVAEGVANGRFLWSHLRQQLPAGLVILGLVGWAVQLYRQWRVGLALVLGIVATSIFVWLFPPAVWAPAALMPVLLLLVAGVAVLLAEIGRRWTIGRWLAVGALLLLAVSLYRTNRPFIDSLTQNPDGRAVIQTLQTIPPDATPATVAIPWGTSFFAAAYGRYVTHELPPTLTLVDHRANFREIVQREGRLLTPTFTAGYWSPETWRGKLGEVHFNLAAPGVVEMGSRPYTTTLPAATPFDVGNGIQIRHADVERTADAQLLVTVYWQAMEPVAQNYSVAVHLVAAVPPQGPQDILAQADTTHPVSGYAPTTTWQSGELIRDMYLLPIPEGSTAQAIRLTMYSQDENGQFINNNWLTLALP
jgi:4-amino-4-deoxy-L-arabinose transferase-like glycosyltransferase